MRTPVEVSAKILLAGDDNDMRHFLVKALQNAGYSVASFDNGVSAHNRLREERFELLLTDIVMPEMDGIELARCATRLDPEIKVMFITGFAAVALNPDNNAPKDARILSKPFHLRDLVNRSNGFWGRPEDWGPDVCRGKRSDRALRAHHVARQHADAALHSPWFGCRADRAVDLEAAAAAQRASREESWNTTSFSGSS
jgi:two-component system cell cycle response regulator CpdR